MRSSNLNQFAVAVLLVLGIGGLVPIAAQAGDQVELLASPCRLYDSRNIGSAGGGSLVTTTTFDTTNLDLDDTDYTHAAIAYNYQGGQAGCRVPAAASGIIANLTVVNPSGAGYARLWATGELEPLPASITFASGQTDEATGLAIRLGFDGQISIHLPFASAHVIVDITGWVEDATTTGLSGEVANVTVADPSLTVVTLDSGSKIWCQTPFVDPTTCNFTVGDIVTAIGRPLIDTGRLVVVAHVVEAVP